MSSQASSASSQQDSQTYSVPVIVVPAIVARLRAAGCVFAEDEADLLVAEAATAEQLADMVERRVAGFPLEQVLGWAEFYGLRIAVDPGVFVPRRRTELLVQEGAALARQAIQAATATPLAPSASAPLGEPIPPTIVDLCCGSGAVGAALAHALGRIELHAADIEPAAVACARRNLAAVGGRVYSGDLYQPLPATLRGRINILIANAPYVPTEAIGTLPQEARLHEPRVALDGGPDGLDVLRRVTEAAPRWLAPGGSLLFEISEGQAPGMVETVARSGLIPRVVGCEDLDATIVVATAPTAP
jgi:release factor glutamine methyltransferase